MDKYAALIMLAGVALLTLAFFGFTSQNTPIAQLETSSSELQATPTTLYWGNIQQGAVVTRAVTLSNTGASHTQPLHMTNTCTVGNVAWNLEGVMLKPNQTAEATFILQVAFNAPSGAFNFTITIQG